MPTPPSPCATCATISTAASAGATTGLAWSWARAVVANSSVRSATACSTVANNSALSRIWSAPAEARCAATFGQPSRGFTILKRESAKLPIARAAMPIFSPSCGSTRITTGPAKSKPDLVLSVPEPDISHVAFLNLLQKVIQLLKVLNQLAKHLIQNLIDRPRQWPEFSSRITGLVAFPEVRPKPQGAVGRLLVCASGGPRLWRIPP